MANITPKQFELIKKINLLKKERNALILAHNYQWPEIYQIADFIGDSYELALKGMNAESEIIVFCGVSFMAETAKILNPGKKVLLPSKESVCPMAAMISKEQLIKLKEQYPKAATVAYVNTTADVKAEVDVCCTSANALKVINALSQKKIIMVPDKNLANYIQTKTDKEIISGEGYCYVHSRIILDKILQAKKTHPKAILIAHPECSMEVIAQAEAILSTSQMIRYAKESKAKEFIVATEIGMVEILKINCPDKIFYSAGGECIQQKKNNLEKVLKCLIEETNEVVLEEEVMNKARRALEKMIEVTIK